MGALTLCVHALVVVPFVLVGRCSPRPPFSPLALCRPQGLTAGEARLRELQEKRGADKSSGKKKAGKSK